MNSLKTFLAAADSILGSLGATAAFAAGMAAGYFLHGPIALLASILRHL